MNSTSCCPGHIVGAQGMLSGSEWGEASVAEVGEFATVYPLGPSLWPSGLRPTEGPSTLPCKWQHLQLAFQKESVGTFWHLLSAQLYPCHAWRESPAGLILEKLPNFPGPHFIHLHTDMIKPTFLRCLGDWMKEIIYLTNIY